MLIKNKQGFPTDGGLNMSQIDFLPSSDWLTTNVTIADHFRAFEAAKMTTIKYAVNRLIKTHSTLLR